MINHSISNKMISINSLNQLSAEINAPQTSRRRRTPSKYAESIKELTKMTSKTSKKDRNQSQNQQQTPPIYPTKPDKSAALQCILPTSGKKLKLSIIIKKNSKPNLKLKKVTSSLSIEKQKDKQKQKQKNTSLLDTLLQVVEQYKADDLGKKEESSARIMEPMSAEMELIRKDPRPKKDREEEQKYYRFYEKYRILNDKFELMQNQIIMI